jgi:aspartate kinase
MPIVVVSAIGKTTDALLAALEAARAGDGSGGVGLVAALREETFAILRDVFGDGGEAAAREIAPAFAELERMAAAVAVLKAAPPDARDHFLAQGELISSAVVARVLSRDRLPAVRVDAREVLVTDDRFGRATPDAAATELRCRDRLAGPAASGSIPVVGGFVGAAPDGRTTVLGRGGSDYSAAIFGACLDARRVEIWTDVDGMMTADPRIVPEARVLDRISPEEASELAYFGARVLHPLTLAPAIEKGIPVHVRNSRKPEGRGTEIAAAPSDHAPDVRSIACKRGIATLDVVTSRMLMASGFLRTLFEVFERHDTAVDMVTTSEISVSVTVDDPARLPDICRDLRKIAQVEVARDRAMICLVGQNLKFTAGIAAKIFGTLADFQVLMISQGASRRNVSFVVEDADAEAVVRLLHETFFGEGAPLASSGAFASRAGAAPRT